MVRNCREKHGSLACRIAPAHYDYVFAFAELRLHKGGSVVHAGPFESCEVRNLQSAVLGATGDNDSLAANGIFAVTFDGERLAIASYGRRPTGNGNLRSELLGLHERPGGKVLPRNSQWKSQVIFDSRTGARLAARSDRLQHQHAQPLRSTVYCCRQTRRPRANHDQVINPLAIDFSVKPETRGQLRICWIAHRRLIAAYEHRAVFRSKIKALQQLAGGRILAQFEICERMPVVREEFLEAERVGGISGADQDYVSHGAGDHRHAPANEHAKHELAQFRIGLKEVS